MYIQFTLTMPRKASWNGTWSGESSLFARVIKVSSAKKHIEKYKQLLEKGEFYYHFSDGWVACVSVKQIKGNTIKQVRKLSRGFAGYDWMIDSILMYGEIKIKD